MMSNLKIHTDDIFRTGGVMCDFISGWFGGCCGLVLGHPFDTLKVRQQALGEAAGTR